MCMKKRAKTRDSKKKKYFWIALFLCIVMIALAAVIYNIFIKERAILSPSEVNSRAALYYDFDKLTSVKIPRLFYVEKTDDKISVGQKFNEFYSKFGQEELPNVLSNESYLNKDGERTRYSQKLTFSDNLKLTEGKDSNNNTIAGLGGSGDILTYSLEFDNPVSMQGNTTLRMFGREFYVFNYDSFNGRLVILDEPKGHFILRRNMSQSSETKINIFGYDVILESSNDIMASGNVLLKINSAEKTNLNEKGMAEIPMSGGLYLGIEKIEYSENGISEIKMIVSLGKIEIVNNGKVSENSSVLDYLNSGIVSSDGKITKIELRYNDPVFVYPGKYWIMPLFDNLKISAGEFVQNSREETKIREMPNGGINIETNLKNGAAKIGVAYSGGGRVGMGYSENGPFLAVNKGNKLIIENATGKYFVVSAGNESYGESYLIYVAGVSSAIGRDIVTFRNNVTGAVFSIGAGENYSFGNVNLGVISADNSTKKVGLMAVSNGFARFGDNFETYGAGTLNDVNEWIAGSCTGCFEGVQSAIANSGAKAVILNDSSSASNANVSIKHLFQNTNHGRAVFYARASQTNARLFLALLDSSENPTNYVYMYSDGLVKYLNRTGSVVNFSVIKNYSADKWYKIEIEWYPDSTFDFFVDGTKLSSSGAVQTRYNNIGGNIKGIYFLTDSSINKNNGTFYIDDIRVMDLNAGNSKASFGRIYSAEGLQIELPLSVSANEDIAFGFNESLIRNKAGKEFSVYFDLSGNKIMFKNAISGGNNIFENKNKSYFDSEQGTIVERAGNDIVVRYTNKESYAPVLVEEIGGKIYSKIALEDVSGRGNAGILQNAEFDRGEYGNAMKLDRTNYVLMPDGFLSNVGQYTISALYKPSNNIGRQTVVTKSKDYNGQIISEGLFYDNGKFLIEHRESVGSSGIAVKQAWSNNLEPGKTYHVVGVVDRANKKVLIYVNGINQSYESSIGSGTSSYDYGNRPWAIGVAYINKTLMQDFANGAVDEVKIWAGEALSGLDIWELYSAYAVAKMNANLAYPSNCSNESIKGVWQGVFNKANADEPSLILTDNSTISKGCKEYYAFGKKGSNSYILHGISSEINENDNVYGVNEIRGVVGVLVPEYENNLSNVENISGFRSLEFAPDLVNYNLLANKTIKRMQSADSAGALSIARESFENTFEILNINKIDYGAQNLTSFENIIRGTNNAYAGWNINANYSYNLFVVGNRTLLYSLCVPVWASATTSCAPSNQRIKYYYQVGTNCNAARVNETESCVYCAANWGSSVTDCLPGDKKVKYYYQTGTTCNETKENETIARCDYDGNNLIGTFSEVDDGSLELSYKIGGNNANYSMRHIGTKRIEVLEGSIKRVEFDYDFADDHKLNVPSIGIKRQSSGYSYGYIIIKGIENMSKTARIDRKTNSKKVCIKDSNSVSDLSSFSGKCDADDEELVECNGQNSNGYVCNIDGNYFVVSGLLHSAVKEYVESSSGGGTSSSGGGGSSGGTSVVNQTSSTSSSSSGIFQNSGTSTGGTGTITPTTSESDTSSTIWLIVMIVLLVSVTITIVFLVILYFREGNRSNNPASVYR